MEKKKRQEEDSGRGEKAMCQLFGDTCRPWGPESVLGQTGCVRSAF